MSIRWIPVDVRMPDEEMAVLMCVQGQDEPVWMGYRHEGQWKYIEGWVISGVTHWAELPAPPGESTIDSRASNLVEATKDLLATIDLHTDCMSNQIDREALDPWMDVVEVFLDKEEKNNGT